MIPVQFITHQTSSVTYEQSAMLALEGGCRWIQLRMKGVDDDDVAPIAKRLLAACRQQGATFIIDDRVELTQAIGADGVHLGRHDMPVAEARKLLGEGFLIGGTANTVDDIRELHRSGADYVGCGPFRFTKTKENLSPILGLEGYAHIMDIVNREAINIPVCAIGGITLADVPAIMATGVDGIAVSGAVLQSDNPVKAMHDLIHAQ